MTVLIIEDETAAARRLEKMVLEIEPDAIISEKPDSVESAVEWLSTNPAPDLILMDIHLADGSSFEIFDHLEVTSPVIFTTAYDEHALRAFKENTVDYLLKPVKPVELNAAFEKYRRIHAAPPLSYRKLAQSGSDKSNGLRRVLIRMGNSFKLVEINDNVYFYTRDKITFLVSGDSGKRYPTDYTLDKLEEVLDPAQFFRINRQFIVGIKSIREMQMYSKGRVKIDLEPEPDQETVVSVERSAAFKKWLVEN
jgi:two-component system LytT family response regulator